MNRYGLRFFFRWWAREIIPGVWTRAEPITFRRVTKSWLGILMSWTSSREIWVVSVVERCSMDWRKNVLKRFSTISKFRKLAKLIRDPFESLVENLSKDDVEPTKARKSLESVTSRFCNHFTCKMCFDLPGIKLEPAPQIRRQNWTFVIVCSRRPPMQLPNWSFHVVERTRTSAKCLKMKNARAKRAKLLFLIVKYANLWHSCYRRCLICSLFRRQTRRSLRKRSDCKSLVWEGFLLVKSNRYSWLWHEKNSSCKRKLVFQYISLSHSKQTTLILIALYHYFPFHILSQNATACCGNNFVTRYIDSSETVLFHHKFPDISKILRTLRNIVLHGIN